MKNYSRKDRVAEQVKRELADILRFELKDPRVGLISLTGVEVTPDYAHAKVFFSTLAAAEKLPEVMEGLQRSAGFVRRQLGLRIHLHTLPQLHFVYDASIERGNEMSVLIDQALASDQKFIDAQGGAESEAAPDSDKAS